MRVFIYVLLLAGFTASAQRTTMTALQNRAPLKQNPYLSLPLGDIKARGWLHTQLVKMKTGMTGQLDELYATVLGSRNGWLGGDGDV